MDRKVLVGTDGTTLIDGLTDNIDNATEALLADGDHNGVAHVHDGLATDEAFSGVKSNGAHVIATQMLGDLEHKAVVAFLNLKGIENGGERALELNVDDSTNNLRNLSGSRGKAA